MGLKGPTRARQEEVVAVTPWPGAQTSYWRGAPKIVATPLAPGGQTLSAPVSFYLGEIVLSVPTFKHMRNSKNLGTNLCAGISLLCNVLLSVDAWY